MEARRIKRPTIAARLGLKSGFYKYSLVIELVVVFVLFQVLTGGTFMRTRNLSNLMMQGVTCSLMAVTMMLVIVSCNADLSAGSVLGFMGTVAATLQVNLRWGTAASIGTVLLCGLAIGLWHGYWIGYKKLPAFIVTLATQLVFKGLTLLIGKGYAIGPVTDSFSLLGRDYVPNLPGAGDGMNLTSLIIAVVGLMAFFAFSIYQERKRIAQGLIEPRWGRKIVSLIATTAVSMVVASIFIFYKGFPYAVLLLIALAIVFAFIVKNTCLGRHIFAIGGNQEASRMSGINNDRVVLHIYMLHSAVVALASIVYLGRVGQAAASSGTGFEFTAITGCVVGGTSITGGRGTVVGAIIGTMLMAALDNGMSLLNLGQSAQYIVKGLVLMFAIAMDVISRNKNG